LPTQRWEEREEGDTPRGTVKKGLVLHSIKGEIAGSENLRKTTLKKKKDCWGKKRV